MRDSVESFVPPNPFTFETRVSERRRLGRVGGEGGVDGGGGGGVSIVEKGEGKGAGKLHQFRGLEEAISASAAVPVSSAVEQRESFPEGAHDVKKDKEAERGEGGRGGTGDWEWDKGGGGKWGALVGDGKRPSESEEGTGRVEDGVLIERREDDGDEKGEEKGGVTEGAEEDDGDEDLKERGENQRGGEEEGEEDDGDEDLAKEKGEGEGVEEEGAKRGEEETAGGGRKQESEEEEDKKEKGKEKEEEEEGEEDEEEGFRLAWIPADPCSCVDSAGVVGQACRAWLKARAPPSSKEGTEVSSFFPSVFLGRGGKGWRVGIR